MGDLEWLVKMVPQGAAVSAVVGVVSLFLLRYIPSLLKDQRDTVQGIVTTHSETLKEEREMFRGEMKELRTTFAAGLKDVTDAFTRRDEALSGRIDNLTEAHRDLRDEVHGLKTKLEA